MVKKKQKIQYDFRYEVEWCSEIPIDESGDRDIDRAKYEYSHFKTLKQAIKFALKTLPKDAFGCIRVEEQELQIDQDTLEHEGWERKAWHPLRVLHVDGADYKYSKKDFESIGY